MGVIGRWCIGGVLGESGVRASSSSAESPGYLLVGMGADIVNFFIERVFLLLRLVAVVLLLMEVSDS